MKICRICLATKFDFLIISITNIIFHQINAIQLNGIIIEKLTKVEVQQ